MQPTESRPAPPALRAFVRQTLGCSCPEDVFQTVDRAALVTAEGVPVTRLVIGGRLLIYLAAETGDAARLAGLVAAGRLDRDRSGLNRFRLVVGPPAEAGGMALLEAAFRVAAGADAKAHLHCVPAAAFAEALSFSL